MDSREEISDLLALEGKIDLAIPRGGQDLVRAVMETAGGRMPVLGHTEGVCHVFVDQHADLEKALRISERDNAQCAFAFHSLTVYVHSNRLQVQLSSSLQCNGESSGSLCSHQHPSISHTHFLSQR